MCIYTYMCVFYVFFNSLHSLKMFKTHIRIWLARMRKNGELPNNTLGFNQQKIVACLPKLWMVHAQLDVTLKPSLSHQTTQVRWWAVKWTSEPSSHWWLAGLCASTDPWTCPEAGKAPIFGSRSDTWRLWMEKNIEENADWFSIAKCWITRG